jgi:hypothetical protein
MTILQRAEARSKKLVDKVLTPVLPPVPGSPERRGALCRHTRNFVAFEYYVMRKETPASW